MNNNIVSVRWNLSGNPMHSLGMPPTLPPPKLYRVHTPFNIGNRIIEVGSQVCVFTKEDSRLGTRYKVAYFGQTTVWGGPEILKYLQCCELPQVDLR